LQLLLQLLVEGAVLQGDEARVCHEAPQHTSAYVSIRQHTSAYVSIRQKRASATKHLSVSVLYVCTSKASKLRTWQAETQRADGERVLMQIHPLRVHLLVEGALLHGEKAAVWHAVLTPASQQHTSAYVSIRRHTSAYVGIRQHTKRPVRQHTYATCADCC
jgi:isocitrate/isopropylmalate dehydrogenase